MQLPFLCLRLCPFLCLSAAPCGQQGLPLLLQHGRQRLAPVGHGAGPKDLQSYRVCGLQYLKERVLRGLLILAIRMCSGQMMFIVFGSPHRLHCVVLPSSWFWLFRFSVRWLFFRWFNIKIYNAVTWIYLLNLHGFTSSGSIEWNCSSSAFCFLFSRPLGFGSSVDSTSGSAWA